MKALELEETVAELRGAHPDDENTQLIAYLSRGRAVRAAYLSITRGDGGQNLLGPELGYKLGVFQTRGGYAREITAFVSFYGVNYAANWIALPALVEVGHIPPIIAQLMFSAVIILTSYFWHSKVTFRGAK